MKREVNLAVEKLEKKFPGSAQPGSTELHKAPLGRSSLSQHVEGGAEIEVDLRAAIIKSENVPAATASSHRAARRRWGMIRDSIENEKRRRIQRIKALAMGSLVTSRMCDAASRMQTVTPICDAVQESIRKVGVDSQWMELLKDSGPNGRAAIDHAERVKAGIKSLMTHKKAIRALLTRNKGGMSREEEEVVSRTKGELGDEIFDEALSTLNVMKVACTLQGNGTESAHSAEALFTDSLLHTEPDSETATQARLASMIALNEDGLPSCATDASAMEELEKSLNLSALYCLMDDELVEETFMDLASVLGITIGVDVDGDGHIDASEMMAPNRVKQLQKIFDSLDRDGSGRVDMVELWEILRHDRPMRRLVGLDEKPSLESTAALFGVIDSEGDGDGISLKEFLGYFLGSSADEFWSAIRAMEENKKGLQSPQAPGQGKKAPAPVRTERWSPEKHRQMGGKLRDPAVEVQPSVAASTPPPSPKPSASPPLRASGFRTPMKFLSTMLARSAKKESTPDEGVVSSTTPSRTPLSEEYVRKEDMDAVKVEMSSIKLALSQIMQATGLSPTPSPSAPP